HKWLWFTGQVLPVLALDNLVIKFYLYRSSPTLFFLYSNTERHINPYRNHFAMNRKLHCVLLIDDDEPTNFLNRLAIEEQGCVEHIKVIPSARDALDYLACATQPAPLNADCPKPELIFLDINMPAMDGWEFLHYYET